MFAGSLMYGQATGPVQEGMGPALPPTSALLQPALSELQQTLGGIRISKWKAPGPVRDDAQSNVGSIDRDMEGTLPGLMSQADATPHSVANSFAVYRNVNAMYEVLLRVSETADLAASDNEAQMLAHALSSLESARNQLGESILTTSKSQETALTTALDRIHQTQTVAAAAPGSSTVVKDGPDTETRPKPKAKKKPAPSATAPTPQKAAPAPQN
jgi:hypothetical protein